MYGNKHSRLFVAMSLAAPLFLFGCGGSSGGGESVDSGDPSGENNDGSLITNPDPAPAPEGVDFAVLAEQSATESCAALDAVVAIHDQNGNLLRTTAPEHNGSVNLGNLEPSHQVTVFDETAVAVRAVSVKAAMLPDQITWTLTPYDGNDYDGNVGDCVSSDALDVPSFEAVATNAGDFSSVGVGPTAKFLSSLAATSDRATMMADEPYRLMATGYSAEDATGNQRLEAYGLTDVIAPADGSTVNVRIDTPTTPVAISLAPTTSFITSSWIGPDKPYLYDLESIAFGYGDYGDAQDFPTLNLNTVEPNSGKLHIAHSHSDYGDADTASELIVEELANSGAIELSSPDLSALTNVNYSAGEISYEFTGQLRGGEEVKKVTLMLTGRNGSQKQFYHTVMTDNASGFHRLPDLGELIEGEVSEVQSAGVNLTITSLENSVFLYTLGSNGGISGIAEIPETLDFEDVVGPYRLITNVFLNY